MRAVCSRSQPQRHPPHVYLRLYTSDVVLHQLGCHPGSDKFDSHASSHITVPDVNHFRNCDTLVDLLATYKLRTHAARLQGSDWNTLKCNNEAMVCKMGYAVHRDEPDTR